MSGIKIFGYDWSDIQAAQQGDAKALKRRPVEDMDDFGECTALDQHLLDQYGSITALEDAGLHGVADRAKSRSQGANGEDHQQNAAQGGGGD